MTKRKFNPKTRKKWSWGKCGYYKKIWCDSSWELAFLVFNLDNKIKIKRNRKGFKYHFYGKKHLFYPDFIIDNEYIEIKGKVDRKTISKVKQFPKELSLVLIEKTKIQKYLKYAIDKYGKDFADKLYQ